MSAALPESVAMCAPVLSPFPALPQALNLRLLDSSDALAVMKLRARVLAQLSHPDQYVAEADEEQFVLAHLHLQPPQPQQSWGTSIGIWDGAKLVAYAMLGLPAASDSDNLAYCTGSDITLPAITAHLASCMVLPEYRGRHLQRILLNTRRALAKAWGRDCCLAMVSLHNHASRHNLMREGLCVSWIGEIDGLQRQLLACNQARPWYFDMNDAQTVSSLDWQAQKMLLKDGWWGVRSLREPQGSNLVFARRLSGLHS